MAEQVRKDRRPVSKENVFWEMQEKMSVFIVHRLDAYNEHKKHDGRKDLFTHIYGSPLVQAAIGLRTVRPYAKPSAARDVEVENERNQRLLKLMTQVETGGLAEGHDPRLALCQPRRTCRG